MQASINNSMQEIKERISGAEDTRENINKKVKENAKGKTILTQNIQKTQDTMRRQNLRIIGIKEREDSQLKGPVNIFNKIIKENIPNLKKAIPMNIQEAYRSPNILDQKRKPSCHIIKTPNVLNKKRILKPVREKSQVTRKAGLSELYQTYHQRLKARRSWAKVTLRECKCQSRLLYPAKLLITIDGETKIFHEKNDIYIISFHKSSPSIDNR